MSSPNMDHCSLTVGAVAQTIPDSQIQKAVHSVPDAALTARALVAVAALGGGIWYLLWKVSLHFVVGH
jgi:hypothetical protein